MTRSDDFFLSFCIFFIYFLFLFIYLFIYLFGDGGREEGTEIQPLAVARFVITGQSCTAYKARKENL